MYKVKYKITSTQRNEVASFHPQNGQKNTPGRATFQAKIQVDDLHFYIKTTPHRGPSRTPLVKTNPDFPEMEH